MASFQSRRLIERLIRRAEPKIRREFGLLVAFLKRQNSLDDLAFFISTGRMDLALATLDLASERFANTVIGVMSGAAEEVSDGLASALGIQVSFDRTNIEAVQAFQRNRLRLVREFSQGQRGAVREALTDGIRLGLNPRQQAVAFRNSIGLTGKQQRAVSNFRAALERNSSEVFTRKLRDRRFDSKIRQAIANGKPLSRGEIERMVGRYQERFVKFRSEVIARTEALRSAHEGAEVAFKQATEKGHFPPEAIRRIWNTASDERVRSSHTSMHLLEARVNEPFPSGLGNLLLFPGDPAAPPADTIQCRCVLATRVSL